MLNHAVQGPNDFLNTFPGSSQVGISSGQLQGDFKVTIPINMGDWRKLTRATQIKILDELDILKHEAFPEVNK